MAYLLGTAGHVDHGKTTLIQALTGINADRLPEERLRGMTIELGFAHIDLPKSGRVSIVDVPGHERFLTNMLSGATAMDVVLLCVAADCGVMAQTRDHFQMIDLLPVRRLLVALTRADLVDAEQLDLAKESVRELLSGTRFEGSSMLAVSAKERIGIDDLRTLLDEAVSACSESEPAAEEGWMLPIDRVFNVRGYGVVVTGTLRGGVVQAGSEAVLSPDGRKVRIRGIQSHDETVNSASPGTRVSLNLVGVDQSDVQRGMVVGAEGAVQTSRTIDLQVRWIAKGRHAEQVRVAIGADEQLARLFLSDADPDIAQVRFDFDMPVSKGQPVILRRHSPPELLGGGTVIVPVAERRRKSEPVEARVEGTPEEVVLQIISEHPDGVANGEICRRAGKTPQQLGGVIEHLSQENQIIGFAGIWFTPDAFLKQANHFLATLKTLHEESPKQAWLPRETVVERAKLNWDGKPLDRILARISRTGKIDLNGTRIRLRGFVIQLNPKQDELLKRVEAELEKTPVNVPFLSDLATSLKVPHQAVHEILELGQMAERIIKPEEGIYYTRRQFEAIKKSLIELLGARPFTAAEARNLLGTTRKYIIPVLEMLDRMEFTVRRGDMRVIRNTSAAQFEPSNEAP